MPREILLNAFDMACIGHIQQGLWTHPRDRSTDYLSLEYWTRLARTLERGLFDGLFLADVLGVYDVLGGNADAALRHAVQVPLLDPVPLVPAMAATTAHLGFGVTCATGYEPPFLLARRLSTLDHLTRGRIGWNVVTGYLDSAARAMGRPAQGAHDDRYDAAEAFLGDVYALWEGSWAADAVQRDRAAGRYADPAKVRAVQRPGMETIHLVEPSPQRTPVLYQAGASDRGRAFAARHAECVFLNAGSRDSVARLVADLRARAAPRRLRIFVGATLVIGATETAAHELLEEYRHHASVEGALAQSAGSLGIDFARFGMDEPISTTSNAVTSNVEAMARRFGAGWTKRQLIDSFILGSRQAPIIGSAAQVAEALIAWVEETDVDGFNLSRTVMPECVEAVVDLLVPELQSRGAYKRAYRPGTYREKLFGEGALLRPPHPAASSRA
jgi:FMN-dependent oxidoreductase (nitrilotriacetate monooxygenase family)